MVDFSDDSDLDKDSDTDDQLEKSQPAISLEKDRTNSVKKAAKKQDEEQDRKVLWMPGMGADPRKRGSSAVPKKAALDEPKKKPESKKGKDWRYLPRADVNRSAAARGPTKL